MQNPVHWFVLALDTEGNMIGLHSTE